MESALRPEERSARYRHNGAVIWLTGLPGSGKSTLARALERRLFGNGGSPILLDGDTLRAGLNGDLGFSAQDRTENIRRLAEVATHLARNGHIAIVAAVSPSTEDRAAARRIADAAFREIHVATPAEVCESRDPKGHYAKARAGTLQSFTGIGNDYQPPAQMRIADRHLDPDRWPMPPTRSSGCWRRPAFCSTNWSIWRPISKAFSSEACPDLIRGGHRFASRKRVKSRS